MFVKSRVIDLCPFHKENLESQIPYGTLTPVVRLFLLVNYAMQSDCAADFPSAGYLNEFHKRKMTQYEGRPASLLRRCLQDLTGNQKGTESDSIEECLKQAQIFNLFATTLLLHQQWDNNGFVVDVSNNQAISITVLIKCVHDVVMKSFADAKTGIKFYDQLLPKRSVLADISLKPKIMITVKKLCDGSWGNVYRAYDVQKRSWVALKIACPNILKSLPNVTPKVQQKCETIALQNLEEETKSLLSLEQRKIPHVVKLKAYHPQCLALELHSGGDLFNLAGQLPDDLSQRAFYAEALWGIIISNIENGVLYPDLKLENFLFSFQDDNLVIVNNDVGGAFYFRETNQKLMPGTLCHACPKINALLKQTSNLQDIQKLNLQQQLFMAANALFDLLSGSMPRSSDGISWTDLTKSLNIKALEQLKCSKETIAFFVTLLHEDPKQRYQTWEEAMKAKPKFNATT